MGDKPMSREAAAGNSRQEGRARLPVCRSIMTEGYCEKKKCRFIHPKSCRQAGDCTKEICKKPHLVEKCVEWKNCENPACESRHSAERGDPAVLGNPKRSSENPATNPAGPSKSPAPSKNPSAPKIPDDVPQNPTAPKNPTPLKKPATPKNPGTTPKNPDDAVKNPDAPKNLTPHKKPATPKNSDDSLKNPTVPKNLADTPKNPATALKNLAAPKDPDGSKILATALVNPAVPRNPATAPKNPTVPKNLADTPKNLAAPKDPDGSKILANAPVKPAVPKNPATVPKNPTASTNLADTSKNPATAPKDPDGSKILPTIPGNPAVPKNPDDALTNPTVLQDPVVSSTSDSSVNPAPENPTANTKAETAPSLNRQFQEAVENCEQDLVKLKEEIQQLYATITDNKRNTLTEHIEALESEVEKLENLRKISLLAMASAAKLPGKLQGDQMCREIFRLKNRLPVSAARIEFVNAVRSNQFVVVRGETGSGKSTQLTQFLMDMAEFSGKKVICTQPRKTAPISLAQRVTYEFAGGCEGAKVGDYVGYRVGGARRISKKTCIEYMTESMLLKIINKPEENGKDELKDCCAVIIDEAHVRSINTDVLMGILKRDVHRWPNLKVIVISATIDTRLFSEYFHNCPVVEIPGRLFPVEVVYKPCEGDTVDAVVREAVDLCKKQNSEGHILCFLADQEEVETAAEMAKASLLNVKNIQIYCLYEEQLVEEQQRVFQRVNNRSRKVIFATDVAETSLTIDGVRIVIDSGVIKSKIFDSRRNVTTLEEILISRTSAIQRQGRAGRTSPGVCYRLYTDEDYEDMLEADPAQVFERPLAMAVVMLKAMNVDPLSFDWIERPEEAALAAVQQELTLYGALDHQSNLTELGYLIAELQIDPGIANMIFYACARGFGETAVELAALFAVSSMVFGRGENETSCKAADQKKEEMVSDKGDIVSINHVYQQWMDLKKQPAKKRRKRKGAKAEGKPSAVEQWCLENRINNKSLEIASRFHRELIGQLKQLPIWHWSVTQNKKANDEEIQQLVLQALLLNVACLVNRNYVCILNDVAAYVHPGSVLFEQEFSAMPKLIVFQTLLETSRVYVTQLTPVSWEWLERDNGALHAMYREKSLELRISQVRFDNLPHFILQNIVNRSNKRLNTIKAEMDCSISADFFTESLVAWCKPRDEETVRAVLDEEIEKIRHRARLAVQEEVLLGRTRLVWGSGGMALALLFDKDYVSFNVSNVPEGWDMENIVAMVAEEVEEDLIRSCVSPPRKQDEDSTCWKVTIGNPEKAEQIFKALDNFQVLGNRLEVSPASVYTPAEFRETCGFLKISFAMGPSNGTAILMYDTAQDANRVLDVRPDPLGSIVPSKNKDHWNPPVGPDGRFRNYRPKKKQKFVLFVNRLPKYLDENGILKTLEDANLPAPSYVCVAREKTPQKTRQSPEEIVRSQNLAPFVEKIVNRVPFIEAKRKRAGMKIFYDSMEEIQLGRLMTSCVMIYDQPVVYETGFNTSVMVEKDLYEIRKEEFEDTAQYARSNGMDIHINPKKFEKRVAINIQAPTIEELERIRKICSEILSFSVLKNPKHRLFFTQYGRKILEKELSQSPLKDAFIHRDFSLTKISVYGTKEQREEALNKLNSLLKEMENLAIEEQILIQRSCIQQVKKSIKDYKTMFPELRELRVGGNRLFVTGTSPASQGLRERLDELQLTVKRKAVDNGDCGICFDTLEDCVTLEICNHKFCMECIVPSLEMLELTLPIECPFENCGTPLSVKDIQQMASPVALERIKQLAVMKLVKEKVLLYAECFQRGCPQYLPISNRIKSKTSLEEVRRGGSVVSCDQCATWYCVTCSRALKSPVKRHRGLNCAQRQLDHENENQRNVRFHRLYIVEKFCTLHCPRCSTAFDSFSGCCALSCICGAVFCFFCLGICAGDGHPHVVHCPKNPSPGQLYLQPHVSPLDVHKASRKTKILHYLVNRCVDNEVRREVLKAIQVDIRDLGIRITPAEVGLREEPNPEEVRRHRNYIVEEILTLKCPRCKRAFHDFDGCCALVCPFCTAGFCYCCLQDCGRDAHEHVRSCSVNPFKTPFIPAGSLGTIRANIYKKLITSYLSTRCRDQDMIAAVLQAADKDLRDVNVRMDPRDITITPGGYYRADPAGSRAAGMQNYQPPNPIRPRPDFAVGPNVLAAPARPANNPPALPNAFAAPARPANNPPPDPIREFFPFEPVHGWRHDVPRNDAPNHRDRARCNIL